MYEAAGTARHELLWALHSTALTVARLPLSAQGQRGERSSVTWWW